MLELMYQRAMENFAARRASAPRQLANDRRLAGRPMVYYCTECGWVSDILHEEYFLAVPRRICSECLALAARGWLPKRGLADIIAIPSTKPELDRGLSSP